MSYDKIRTFGNYKKIVLLDQMSFGDYGTIELPETLSMFEGEVVTLHPVYNPAGEYTETWTSSNPSVASVSGGVVTAHRIGSATITLNVEGVIANVKVTVGELEGLALPADLTRISEGAFSGVSARYVLVPAGVKEIGANAFDDCPDGMRVEIASAEIFIHENAFGDSNVVIICQEGSPAMNFALAHGIEYQLK